MKIYFIHFSWCIVEHVYVQIKITACLKMSEKGKEIKSFQTGANAPRIDFYVSCIYLYRHLFFRAIQRIFVYFPCYHWNSNMKNFFFSFIFVHSQKTNVSKIFLDKIKCTCIKDMSPTSGQLRLRWVPATSGHCLHFFNRKSFVSFLLFCSPLLD